MVDTIDVVEEKEYQPKIEKRSVVELPDSSERSLPLARLVFNIATAADTFPQWGMNLKRRDAELRSFWISEPILASAVYTISSRISILPWRIMGADRTKPDPKNTIRAVTRMLTNADRGNGWQALWMKVLTDCFTQDNGAFIEVIRQTNSPDSPVWGIAHLDSFRCQRTGDPEEPVIYADRHGREHLLKWYQVIPVEEMPSPVESMHNAQVCAVSRALRAAQIIRDIAIYKQEKVSGNFAKALHIVSGITQNDVEDALAHAQEQTLNQNLYRYVQPMVIPTIDPNANLKHIQLDLATLPDHFDEETTLKWYISQLALAFGVDYQEFAPLPSGALGSSQQSEILHLKSSGKGPATMISLIEHILNENSIIPRTTIFEFVAGDVRSDVEKANARFLRGKDRVLRVDAGELDIQAAREMALEDGDLPDYVFEHMLTRPEPKPRPKQPDPFTSGQVTGGIDSHEERKSLDDLRALTIRRMQELGELNLEGNDPVITPEDIEQELGRIGDENAG